MLEGVWGRGIIDHQGDGVSGRQSKPGDFLMFLVQGKAGEGTTEGVCFRGGMTSEGLPSARPLYWQVSKGDETE